MPYRRSYGPAVDSGRAPAPVTLHRFLGGQETVRLRSIAVVPLALVWLLAAVVPALAADPPADVVFDGVVTVTFADPGVDGGAGLADAEITLDALRPDLGEDATIQTLSGTTRADGTVVFDGVARPDDGAPTVELRATAHLDRTVTLPDGCKEAQTYDGSATAEGGLETTIQIGVMSASSSITCESVLVSGTVLGPDGEPFEAAHATVRITHGGDTTEAGLEVASDGSFEIVVDGWDAATGDTMVDLRVTSPPTREVPGDDGCADTYALVASHHWDLSDPSTAPDPVIVTATEEVVGQVCQATGTPAPTAVDTEGPGAPGHPSDLGLLAVLVVTAATMLVALGSAVRVSRRGS
jgi:hypothetical protein